MNKSGWWSAGSGLPICFALILLLACAEVAPPPGGPVDTTPPRIVSTSPADGSVNIAPDNRILIQFSERINEPTAGKFVFISPRPRIRPDIDFKSDRIEITLAEPFDSNQTYLVTLGSSIADLRNNRLDSSITIAFSTGETLDSGRISGNVYNGQQPQSGALVALYEPANFTDTTEYDSQPPAYIVSSGEDGYFSFSYLPPQKYRLIAFLDANRDEFLNPAEELFGVPDRECDLTDVTAIEGLYLPLTSVDTAETRIVSAALNDDRLLRVRFTRSISLDLLTSSPSYATMSPLDDTATIYAATSFAEIGNDEAGTIHLLFDSLPENTYRLQIWPDSTRAPLTSDSIEIQSKDDSSPPEVVTFTPEREKVFLRDVAVSLLFSEPVVRDSLTSESFRLWENENTPVTTVRQWSSPFEMSLVGRFRPGHSYRLDVTEFDIYDRAGNVLGDSLRTYGFAIYDPDSLGSASGQIIIVDTAKQDDPVLITFHELEQDFSYEFTIGGRTFNVALPAGRYLLTGFIDSDRDGEISNGSLFPYRLSETRATYSDTVAVRARFETAGIEFTFE